MSEGVIILGDGTTNSLGVTRSLYIAKIPHIVISTNKVNCAMYAKNVEKIIFPDPSQKPVDYIEKLLDLSDRYYNYTLMPTADTSVDIISKNKEKLEEKYVVPVSDWNIVNKCLNKEETTKISHKLNIPIPATYKLSDYDKLKYIMKRISYPCLIKSSNLEDRKKIIKKILIASSKEELLEKGEDLLSGNIYPIVQEFIPGPPSNLIALASILDKKSKPAALFTVKKIRQIPFMFGVGTVTTSTLNTTVMKLALKFLQNIGYCGVSHVEFKYDSRDGKFKLIEINPRLWLHNLLATYCGINFPEILFNLVKGKKNTLRNYRHGVKWHHLTSDSIVLLSQIKSKNSYFSFREMVKSYIGCRVFATLSLNDINPFIHEIHNNIISGTHGHRKSECILK